MQVVLLWWCVGAGWCVCVCGWVGGWGGGGGGGGSVQARVRACVRGTLAFTPHLRLGSQAKPSSPISRLLPLSHRRWQRSPAGRARVSEYDCLLLRHCLWQRPDEAERIYDWLLRWGGRVAQLGARWAGAGTRSAAWGWAAGTRGRVHVSRPGRGGEPLRPALTAPLPLPLPCSIRSNLASDDGLQQMHYLLSGMFGRACQNLGNDGNIAELAQEVGDVRQALTDKLAGTAAGAWRVAGACWPCSGRSGRLRRTVRHASPPPLLPCAAGVYATMNEGFPAVLGNLWLGQDEAQVRRMACCCRRRRRCCCAAGSAVLASHPHELVAAAWPHRCAACRPWRLRCCPSLRRQRRRWRTFCSRWSHWRCAGVGVRGPGQWGWVGWGWEACAAGVGKGHCPSLPSLAAVGGRPSFLPPGLSPRRLALLCRSRRLTAAGLARPTNGPQVALKGRASALDLAQLMPKSWQAFLR